PYEVPNVVMDCSAAYTNNPPCGAMRGFGAVQACFAYESQMDNRVVSIDHLEHATASEVRQIADAGIMCTLLPSVSFGGDGREAPARALLDAGVAVALGSNFNPHHTPALNMQTVVALARGRLGMTIEEAICAATVNGAHALGCAERVGSLEPGKAADLLVLNASHYRDLEHSLGTNLVH